MVEQINKYWKNLFADPIIVETKAGKIVISNFYIVQTGKKHFKSNVIPPTKLNIEDYVIEHMCEGLNFLYNVPANAFTNHPNSVRTFTFSAILVAREDFPEQSVYNKAVRELCFAGRWAHRDGRYSPTSSTAWS